MAMRLLGHFFVWLLSPLSIQWTIEATELVALMLLKFDSSKDNNVLFETKSHFSLVEVGKELGKAQISMLVNDRGEKFFAHLFQ